jgi:esterase/lipase
MGAAMKLFHRFVPALLILILQACATTPLAPRHQESGLNTQFNGDHLVFADYIKQSRAMIRKTHAAASAAELEMIVDGNAPFELKPPATCPSGHGKPYHRGILLTHGLTDSAYLMRSLGDFFQKNCFLVMAILLPGHGTQPGDLLDVKWQEWAKAEAYGTDQLAAEVDEVYLGGFSTGGALSVYQSQQDVRVRGLFLFSPALEVDPLAALANVHKYRIFGFAWLDVMPDKDIYKYESFPKNAAKQIYDLTQAVKSRLKEHAVNIPVFAAASQDDTTVHTSATIDFIARALDSSSKLVLYSTEPANAPPGISPDKLEMVNSVFPEQKILSSAHTAIVVPPDDRHYGIDGDYSNCVHYYPDEMASYDACINRPKEDFQGELTKANLEAGILRRLMYNPNYAALEVSMKKFIDKLP